MRDEKLPSYPKKKGKKGKKTLCDGLEISFGRMESS